MIVFVHLSIQSNAKFQSLNSVHHIARQHQFELSYHKSFICFSIVIPSGDHIYKVQILHFLHSVSDIYVVYIYLLEGGCQKDISGSVQQFSSVYLDFYF